jgi:hypothetical protein
MDEFADQKPQGFFVQTKTNQVKIVVGKEIK